MATVRKGVRPNPSTPPATPLDICQLTLVCLIAVVGEAVSTAAHQTQLVGATGRAARRSNHLAIEVHMRDSEGIARLLRGTVGMTADAVYHEEDQARKRQQQRNRVPHNGRHLWGFSRWEKRKGNGAVVKD